MTIQVVFNNNPDGVYYAGQLMSGFVHLNTTASMKIRGVRAKFTGQARCRWSTGSGKNRRTYTSYQTFFDSVALLFGEPASSSNKTELPAGSHSFPFQYQLPAGIPHSFQGLMYGRVFYYVEVTIDKPWAFDDTLQHVFTIYPHLDLNLQPDAMIETRHSDEKNLCCLCCKSGPISASVFLQRKGYVPGDVLRFYGEISNLSSRACACSIFLLRRVTFHAQGHRRSTEEKLAANVQPTLEPGKSAQFSGDQVLIPLDCGIPSFLQGCDIIEVQYYATVVLVPSGPALNLAAAAEIILGTVPHQGAAAADSVFGQSGFQSAFSPAVIAQPGLSESGFAQSAFPPPVVAQPGATTADGYSNMAFQYSS